MVEIGNFFFKYRNFLFIFLYLALFIPSPQVFSSAVFGDVYSIYPLAIGLAISVMGQLIRGMTISLAYIVRGGKDKKVYADHLVSDGIFAHCRNPLYVGNILMLIGMAILANSLLYLVVFIPLFLFIYHAIVLAEEKFLLQKFGKQFIQYKGRVSRWMINPMGLSKTLSGLRFLWKRWLVKEYNTQVVWLTGIAIFVFFKYNQWRWDAATRNRWFGVALLALAVYYFSIRYLKKSGKWMNG